MNTLQAKAFNFAQTLQWLARGLSVVSIFVILLFFIGEGFNPAALRSKEWVLMIFFPIGVVAGMAIAWWKEGLGAAITITALLAFYVAHYLFAGDLPRGWAFVTFALPGFLFLAHWRLSQK